MPRIVIPDDAPPVVASSQAYCKLVERTHVEYHAALPASEEDCRAEIVISVRSWMRFSENVFCRSPNLRLLSLWGTGTDNVDLPAAARYGMTVTKTQACPPFPSPTRAEQKACQ
jgi:lactate dehydrogenase-like 2-hydroxyacid dehydrogenase